MDKYIVTFGTGQEYKGKPMGGKCVLIHADNIQSAESKMREKYGRNWCASYTYDEWEGFKSNPIFTPEVIVEEIK